MLKIERDIWRLRNTKGIRHAKWLVLALKSLQALAKGIRESLEHIRDAAK